MFDFRDHKISFSQRANGLWYCSEISIYCNSVIDGIALMKRAIEDVEKVLKEKNKNDSKDKS